MSNGPTTPKLKVGCEWILRPTRSLASLTAESHIFILRPENYRHLTLLAKYRPRISFFKSATPWDWAALKARERYSQTLLPTCILKSVTKDSSNTAATSQDSEQPESCVTRTQPTEIGPTHPCTLRPGSTGWPQLHTAQRCLTRRKPRGKVSNDEMYASLRKPPTVDILGPKWRDLHKKSQTQHLQRASARSRRLLLPLEIDALSSLISSARSMTASVTSSTFFRASLHSLPTVPTHHKSANMMTYTPLAKPAVKDNLAPDWYVQHKKRQDRLLQQKHSREQQQEIILSARSVAVAAVSVLHQSVKPVLLSSSSSEAVLPLAVPSQVSVTKAFVFRRPASPKCVVARPVHVPVKQRSPHREPHAMSQESDKQLVEAQIGILKDWLRTQLPQHSNLDSLRDLKEQMDTLSTNHDELRVVVEKLQKKAQLETEKLFATFASTLYNDIFVMLKEEKTSAQVREQVVLPTKVPATTTVSRNTAAKPVASPNKRSFWVPKSATNPIIDKDQTNQVPAQILKVRAIRRLHTTLASQRETARLSRLSLREHGSSLRERSVSMRSAHSSHSEDFRTVPENHPAPPDKSTLPGRMHLSASKFPLKSTQTQDNLVSDYPTLPSVTTKDSATSSRSQSHGQPTHDKAAVDSNLNVKVDSGTQIPDRQEKLQQKNKKLLENLVKALVGAERRLAKCRQENLLLRGIIEQNTVRIGSSVDSMRECKGQLFAFATKQPAVTTVDQSRSIANVQSGLMRCGPDGFIRNVRDNYAHRNFVPKYR